MRWTRSGMLRIEGALASASSLHKAARDTALTRGVLRRLRQRLPLINDTATMLAREEGLFDTISPHAPAGRSSKPLGLPCRWPCWNDFAWRLRQALYPVSRHDFSAPHDMYHPSG